jgi:hypothetical protein
MLGTADTQSHFVFSKRPTQNSSYTLAHSFLQPPTLAPGALRVFGRTPGARVFLKNGTAADPLLEVVPALRRLAILFNVNDPNATLAVDIVRNAAGPLGLEVITSEIRPAEDIAPVFAAIKAAQADALSWSAIR